MRNLWWLSWYLWEGLPTLFAFPIDTGGLEGTGDSWSTYWELKWPRYAIGTLGFVAVALTLGGCLCCRRQRRPKGFQEFKDGSAAATETTIERVPSASLELEVSRIASSSSTSGKIHLEPLPSDRPSTRATAKPKPPSPSLFAEEQQFSEERSSNFPLREHPGREWFEPGNCHVPRERLKYLREIGRGWFGKVVEGTIEGPSESTGPRNRGVVVRILTEEATASEKAWFLGEATPYLKLDHPNVLTLLGSCLEADPYLLLFESCPAGDLKAFLRGNRDKGTCEALRRENVPTRMALDIANALEHMHANGFAHTDLSARNCLVAPDLSAKLGDYGTGVEKYPGDYYVVGDRALPIRWSAPESLDCTETTIETRPITPLANLWSYAVLLWEMATWGERPYDDLGDEQIIELIFSPKSDFRERNTCDVLPKRLREAIEAPANFREAFEATWKFRPEDRASLNESKDILCGKGIEDFEKRWENLKPNATNVAERERDNRSASLQDLRGSVDSELWLGAANDERNPPQANFRLGPEEPVKNQPRAENSSQHNESGSETEEESWRGRVERGAYTEKVKQKSKSVADLMVLVHIDSDSEPDVSLGTQMNEKPTKKQRLPASGSDGDLRSHFLADEFDEAIRKLREPSMCNGAAGWKTAKTPGEDLELAESIEKPKLLTLTNQGETPILRLNFGTGQDFTTFNAETARVEGPVLRLVSKGEPELPLLRYVPGETLAPAKDSFVVYESADSGVAGFSSNSAASPRPEDSAPLDDDDAIDVELWNNALAAELEKKKETLDLEAHATIFDESLDLNATQSPRRSASAPETPKSVRFDADVDPRNYSRKIGDRGDVNYSWSSAPETPRKAHFHPETAENRRKNDTERKIEQRNLAEGSSSAPETPVTIEGANYRENLAAVSSPVMETTCERFFEPETAENRRKNDDGVKSDENYRRNLALGSYSAPETPGKDYFEPEMEETPSQAGNYYENLSTGCSSAPETPRKHYYGAKIAKSNSKDASYYPDSLGSVSAPETPQFCGNYVASQLDEDSSTCEELEASDRQLKGSAPDTPLSRGNYSVGNGDEDSSTGEELDAGERMMKRSSHEIDDEEDRKHLSTPDDERSSDSGFRDKESCEEEESPVPGPPTAGVVITGGISSSINAATSSPLSASAEEEQMRILFELDTILDAEYYGSFRDSDRLDDHENAAEFRVNDGDAITTKNQSISESLESTESTDFVETVRANSCEPDFSEPRSTREIGSISAESRNLEELSKLGEFLRREGEDDRNLLVENVGDDTEDFFGDSTSESLNTDKNCNSDLSSGVLGNLPRDASEISGKNDSKNGEDLSAELRRLNVDSSSDGKFDGSNDGSKRTDSAGDSPLRSERIDSYDLEIEIGTDVGETAGQTPRKTATSEAFEDVKKSSGSTSESPLKTASSEVFQHLKKSSESPSSESPLKTSSSEVFQDIKKLSESTSQSPCKTASSEMFHDDLKLSSDSMTQSPQKTASSDILYSDLKISSESMSQSPLKSERKSDNSEICENLTGLEDFISDSSSKSEKRNESVEIREVLIEFEKSGGDDHLKSENRDESAEISEASVEFEKSSSDSAPKRKKPHETSEQSEASVELEKSASLSFLQSERLHGCLEISTKAENSPSFTRKSVKPHETAEKSESSMDLEISDSLTSPSKSEKRYEIPEKCEPLAELVKLASEEPQKPSEKCESSVGSEKLSSDSILTSEKPHETSEICEASAVLENSLSCPLKSEKPHETAKTCEPLPEFEKPISDSPKKMEKPDESAGDLEKSMSVSLEKTEKYECFEISPELENSSSSRAWSSPEKRRKSSETHPVSPDNSSSDSPLKTDQNPASDLSMETRGPESVHSDAAAEQWSSRENLHDNEEDEEEEDSSTMSLRSDNSYVSFGLDEEFVAAIRNELREKLPRAQMPVIEALDPRDEKHEPSINKDTETKRWEDEEADESADRGSGGVDISIRYNVYGTPLSPILEERESSAGTSESLISKDDDASIASRVSALSEDVLVVDTRTNRAIILEAGAPGNSCEPAGNSQQDEDRDTSHGDMSDEENLEYPPNHFNRGTEKKRICMVSGGAPLPSPEEESKWQQQFPLPLQMQDDLMSTSFGTDRDWDSQDEDEGEGEDEDEAEDEEENSSSSGEFVWKRYDESHGDLENVATRSPPNKPKSHEPEADLEEEEEDEGGGDEEDEEEEEEFTPSAWDATLAPHRSALRSPEKTLKSGDQKKSVWFKKQRYHCVYEYPKETPVAEGQGQAATTWEPTSYADWEEMMDEPRLDVYPMEYDETHRAGDEEFYVSSSNRPFQFQSGEGKYVSQFFPGASSTLLQQQQQQPPPSPPPPMEAPASEDNSQESQDEVDRGEAPESPQLSQANGNSRIPDVVENQQQTQLGELRHTRDRLKLNLLSTSGTAKADQDVVDNIPENSQKKAIDKSPKQPTESSRDSSRVEKTALNTERTRDSGTSPETTKIQENAEIEGEKSSYLAVENASEVKIHEKRDDELETKASGAGKAKLGDDFTVIQGNREVHFVGEEKASDEPREISTCELEKIVDIPKLETEETIAYSSPVEAAESREAKTASES